MRRKRTDGRMDTAWRLHGIGGPDLALRYLELSDQAQRDSHGPSCGDTETRRPVPQRSVIINGVRISDDEVSRLERVAGTSVRDRAYWYDAKCGAWGMEGGCCAGFIQAGMDLGGPLRRDASRGNTGVFVNGRELHALDLMALRRLGPVFPGRYWVDAHGNFGIEGCAMLGNLWVAGRMASGSTGGSWTVDSAFGSTGGDGAGFMFFNDGKNFWST